MEKTNTLHFAIRNRFTSETQSNVHFCVLLSVLIPHPPLQQTVQNQSMPVYRHQVRVFTIPNTFHQIPHSEILNTFQGFWNLLMKQIHSWQFILSFIKSFLLHFNQHLCYNTPTWYKLGTESGGNMSSHRMSKWTMSSLFLSGVYYQRTVHLLELPEYSSG